VATATFWRTFHNDGKISPGAVRGGGSRPQPFTISTITHKVVVYAPAEREDTLSLFLLYPYMYCTLWFKHKGKTRRKSESKGKMRNQIEEYKIRGEEPGRKNIKAERKLSEVYSRISTLVKRNDKQEE
jgi:hypothetical protein